MIQDSLMRFFAQAKEAWKRASLTPYAAVNHIALFVPDLDLAEEHVRQVFNIKSMRLPEDDPQFNDQKYSVFWQGDCYWELIEPKEPLDRTRLATFPPMGYLSEVGYFVPDLPREIERLTAQGWIIQSQSSDDDWREAHMRPDPPTGLIIELIEFFEEPA